MTSTEDAVLDYLDSVEHAINVTTLVRDLPDLPPGEVRAAVFALHDAGQLNRLPVRGATGQPYFVFYSQRIQTAKGCAGLEPVDPVPVDRPADVPALSAAMASRLIERLEQDLAPEPTVERRAPDRRRLGVMEVIDRWRLPFRLSRVIEIVGGARNRKLTPEDAEVVVRLMRQHVKEAV